MSTPQYSAPLPSASEALAEVSLEKLQSVLAEALAESSRPFEVRLGKAHLHRNGGEARHGR